MTRTSEQSATVSIDMGRTTVHVVTDGFFRIDAGTMFGMVPRSSWEKVAPPDDANRLRLAIRCLVVDRPDGLIVVETGFGTRLSPDAAAYYRWNNDDTLVQRLGELGIDPADVTHVIQTHLHLDHAGGLTRRDEDGRLVPTFPNATLLVQRRELDAALHPDALTRGSYSSDDIAPLLDRGLVEPIDGYTEPVHGIACLPTGGHSAGHQAVRVTGGGRTLLYPGDVLPAACNLRPAWISSYDIDPHTTLRAKADLCRRAAAKEALVTLVHDADAPVYRLQLVNDKYIAEPYEG